MSANICWRPVATTTNHLKGVFAPSSFIASMEGVFGGLPITLSSQSIPVLQGMAAVHGDREHNPYNELIEILLSGVGDIEIWAEY